VPLAIAGSCWRLGASEGRRLLGSASWLGDCRWLFNGAGVPVGFRALRGWALGFALRVGGGPAYLPVGVPALSRCPASVLPRSATCYSAQEVQPCGAGLSVYSEPDN
jgi:hypothetical protein